MLTALIDFDVLKYAAGFSVEHKTYRVYDKATGFLVEEFTTKKAVNTWLESTGNSGDDYEIILSEWEEPLYYATSNLDSMIEKILNACGTHKFKGFLTGQGNYREQLATLRPYKGNRNKEHKPVYEYQLHNRMVDAYNATVVHGAEADDAMGIAQVTGQDTIICTIDKDLDMIPGWHYNWKKDTKYWVDEEEAIYNFYYQMLVGDTTDNIQGIKGCGPVTARELLGEGKGEDHYWDVVVKAYQEGYASIWQDALEENARLLWISRREFNDWKPYKEFR